MRTDDIPNTGLAPGAESHQVEQVNGRTAVHARGTERVEGVEI
jgi:hypothetical protein